MRILHIVRNLEVGGMERVVVELAAEQRGLGNDVAVCEVCESGLGRLVVPVGIDHYCAKLNVGRIRRMVSILSVLKRFKPDVVHLHNTVALCIGLWPCLVYQKPTVMTKHGMDFRGGFQKLMHKMPDYVVCVSEPVHARLLALHPSLADRSSVISNGIRMGDVSPADRTRLRKRFSIDTGQRAFVWVGRLVKEKGLTVAVDAFSLCKDDPSWKLFLIGEGNLRGSIEAQVQKLGLGGRVVFLGQRQDVRDILVAFDVFLLPSLTEGLPMALLEAAGAGLPLLVSGVGGMPDVVCRQNGWIVQPGDVVGLANCLGEVCRLETMQLKLMGRRAAAVAEKFSMRVCAERYAEVYHRLVTAV